jgi:hypothetical protein
MLHPGENQFAIVAVNDGDKPSPAGLIGAYLVVLESGALISGRIDGSWKAHHAEQAGWDKAGFDDKSWTQAKEAAAFGDPPWGGFGKRGRHFVMSPVENDTFNGRCDVPPSVDLAKSRVFLVMDGLAPEAAAHIAVNGNYAGGFIGRPFRLDVTKHLKTGSNSLRIAPFAPKVANLVVYANQAM